MFATSLLAMMTAMNFILIKEERMGDAPDLSWQGLVGMCRDKGLLAKELYVVFTKPTGGLEAIFDNLEEHLAFQGELEAKGIMFGAGPFPNDAGGEWGGEGMVIIRADSLEEARKIADSDPMHASGARDYTIRPWLLNEGRVTVDLTYSSGRYKMD